MLHIDRRFLQGQLASLETMEGHGRPWENTACQGPPGTTRASGKAGDHRRETTGDQNVPKSTGAGAARTSGKVGDLEREPTGDHGVQRTARRGQGNWQDGRPGGITGNHGRRQNNTGDHGVLETGGRGKGGRQGVRRNGPLEGDLKDPREGDHRDHRGRTIRIIEKVGGWDH